MQKISRKRVTKTHRSRIKLPNLNTALVEVYCELDKETRVAKDMAVSSKHARKQDKTATELW